MQQGLPTDTFERRSKQRFIAQRRGVPCFWATFADHRQPLTDLSLEAFGLSNALDIGLSFDVRLTRAAVPDEIRARVRVANCFHGPDGLQAGCVFEAFEGDGRERLCDWLVAHVIANATIPITEKDAERIVCGPSLI